LIQKKKFQFEIFAVLKNAQVNLNYTNTANEKRKPCLEIKETELRNKGNPAEK